ncbi:DUF6612 family protein [Lactobacillus sp. PV012]|uniref:DUF6612 family protein n=1 Tax=Lactobacillus sp. PV012 TaxID=2594494 RepID=UPI00223F0795|nr:DUF6612 family protein [Lactobacillus sp. PV012]QNQ81747.1 hypothetical protein FP433_01095 [Lactobacillus sp. PV012]
MKHKNKFFLLFAVLSCLLVLSACGKKENSSSTSTLPSAKSLIGDKSSFSKSIQNGHFEQNLESKKLQQAISLTGNYNFDQITYASYKITNKSKTQTEQLWLTDKKLYMLLQGNHGKWIVTSSDANNFDSSQVTRRFDPDTFSELNDLMKEQAKVKENNSSYTVTYSGTSSEIWKAMNILVVDSMNSPGGQNMNIVRAINVAQLNNLKIQYVYNKSDKKLVSMNFSAKFTALNNANFTWNLNYDDFGQYKNLVVPQKISKNAVEVSKNK